MGYPHQFKLYWAVFLGPKVLNPPKVLAKLTKLETVLEVTTEAKIKGSFDRQTAVQSQPDPEGGKYSHKAKKASTEAKIKGILEFRQANCPQSGWRPENVYLLKSKKATKDQ